jgi:uncharacterized protein (DUF362 family)
MSLQMNAVYCNKSPATGYAVVPGPPLPDVPMAAGITTGLIALRSLFMEAGLNRENQGSEDWNPLGAIITRGDRVVIKPNWVHHRNGSGEGLDCLVTHPSVLEAVLLYAVKARPRSIIVCDAPIQSCNFESLMTAQRLPEIVRRIGETSNIEVGIKDLRRTIRQRGDLSGKLTEECQPRENYVLFDLGSDSLLEPISNTRSEFRVTMYNPDLLQKTHTRGRHQYLVARDVIEADVVINLPKLKTHKKAGLTGALKNMVGINGHKEYLPHHRKGGSGNGGDCYQGYSSIKGLVEELLDAANRARGPVARPVLAGAVRAAMALGKVMGVDNNYEGSWRGNDTVWRMTLDLQRLLHYGLPDGTFSGQVQRKVLTITDAIVAGEGDGPLSPTPVDLGMMTLAMNPAAADWVHALVMGFQPESIPLTREAFGRYRYPLTDFSPEDIVAHVDGLRLPCGELFGRYDRPFRLPSGWNQSLNRSTKNSEIVGESA